MRLRLLIILILISGTETFSQKSLGLNFIPDYTFNGSDLKGWSVVGNGKWSANNGEITTNAIADGSYLKMNRSFQDVAVQLLVKCEADGEIGLLFRVEKKADSTKAIFVSLKDSVVNLYSVALDVNGKIVWREKLSPANGIIRIAPPPTPGQNTNTSRGFRPPAVPNDVPLRRPQTNFQPGEWNQLEIYCDANLLRGFLNDGGGGAAAVDEGSDGFGPIALYASGKGSIQFREIIIKDLAIRTLPIEKSSDHFRVQRINDMYYSWGCTAGDFNKDGQMDVAAGPLIYYGPDFTKSKEIFLAVTTSPGTNFTETNCQYSFDFNNDGWPDILSGPSRGNLYINPKGESRRWDKYTVVPSIQSEITVFKDIDKDGRPELIFAADGAMRIAKPDPSDPTKQWITYDISEKGYANAHGIGTGDVNGDGRVDILNPYGWWEQPSGGVASGLWKYHPVSFARYGHRASIAGGALMGVYDVNGDGLNDVVTSLNAHGFGLAWFEQKRDAGGIINFVQHMISDDYSTAKTNAGGVTLSQIHGNTFADIDGDGIMDLVAGKRYWSHLDTYLDPDPNGAPVIYFYRTVRDPKAPGGAKFVPELIHNRSGVGSDITAVDLNKDGKVDIISSNDRGTFIFWNNSKKAALP